MPHISILHRVLFFCLLLAAPALATAAPSGYAVVLHGLTDPTPWTDGVAEGLQEESGDRYLIDHVYLGGPDLDEDDAEETALSLGRRFKGPVRVVVATDRTGAAFAAKYREDLFPDAAVVLTGGGASDPAMLSLCGDCVRLPQERNLSGLLDLVFTLRPETTLIAGISDSTQDGTTGRALLTEAMQRQRRNAELIFPGHEPGDDNGLDVHDLGQVLADMPARSVLVMLGFAQDNHHEPVAEQTLAGVIGERASAPVFVLDDRLLGSGAVGGVVVAGRDVGRAAARVAERILAGEPAQEMLPEPVRPRVVLDGSALARFGMTAPEGAVVVNSPQTPVVQDGLVHGVAPLAVAGLALFSLLLYLFRRYRQ